MPFGAGCLIIHDWHLLLGLRGPGETEPLTWGPFGGGAEPGEAPAACMLREVREETGQALDPARCAYLGSLRGRGGYPYQTFVSFPDAAPRVVLGPESLDHGWYRLGETAGTLWGNLPDGLHSGFRALTRSPAAAAALMGLRRTGLRIASRPPVPGMRDASPPT